MERKNYHIGDTVAYDKVVLRLETCYSCKYHDKNAKAGQEKLYCESTKRMGDWGRGLFCKRYEPIEK